MSRYRLRPMAEADPADIWRYSAQQWSNAQADVYYRSVIDAFEKVARSPNLGRPFDQGRRGYFSYPIGSHVLFYRRIGDDIEIARVLHRRMNFERHL